MSAKGFFQKYNGVRTTGPDQADPLATMSTAQLISFRDSFIELDAQAIMNHEPYNKERGRQVVKIMNELKRRGVT